MSFGRYEGARLSAVPLYGRRVSFEAFVRVSWGWWDRTIAQNPAPNGAKDLSPGRKSWVSVAIDPSPFRDGTVFHVHS